MNEIVKYDNYMNALNFKRFTTTDYNFLMLICSKMRGKGEEKVSLSFQEIKEKTGYKQHSNEQFISDLKRMNTKLMNITCKLETKSEVLMFVLFPTFRIDKDNQVLYVRVNEDFEFILNEIVKNFTRFDLQEFISLESKYSKNLFRLLKQFRGTGRYETGLSDFRAKMDIPKSCPNYDIKPKIIDPAIKELSQCFKNLAVTIKHAHRRGNPVEGYIFAFEKEKAVREAPVAPGRGKKSRNPARNRFCDFEQHEYTDQELDEQEQMLLQKAKRKLKKS